jgi:hypothetical protein
MSNSHTAMRKTGRVLETLCVVRFALARGALVSAILILFMLLTLVTPQACESGSNVIPPAAPSAAQMIAQKSATVSAAFEFTVLKISGGCIGAAPCRDHRKTCSCCPACSAGMTTESWTLADRNLQHVDDPFVHTPLLVSTESNSLFRPPRLG